MLLALTLILIVAIRLVPTANAFTLTVNAYTGSSTSTYNGDYWGYATTSTSSASSWSDMLVTADGTGGSSAYACDTSLNAIIQFEWGDGTGSTLNIETGYYPASIGGFSGTFYVNGIAETASGNLCNYPYTYVPSGSGSGNTYTGFSSYEYSDGNVAFQMRHDYTATGIYSAYAYVGGAGGYTSNTVSIVIINAPSVSTPTLSTPALDYGSSSGESITVSFNCGSSTICANDYIGDAGSTDNLYSAQNVNSPSSYTAVQSSTSATGAYFPSGRIYNPISSSDVAGAEGQFIIFPALSNPSLSVSGTTASLPTSLTISVPIQSSSGNEASPQATISWGDGSSDTVISSGSSSWSVSGSNYVATVTKPADYSAGTYTIGVSLESANYVNYGSQYGSTSSASQSVTINPYVDPSVSISPPSSNACQSGIWSTKSGSYSFSTTEGTAPTSYINVNWGDGSAIEKVTLSGSSQTISVAHTYSSSGSYTITATIYDTNSRETSSSVGISVNAFQNPSLGSFTPPNATATQSQSFSVSATAGTCPATSITWNWDTSSSSESNTQTISLGSGSSATYTYSHTYQITQGDASQNYDTQITIVDNSNDQSSITPTVAVSYVYPTIGAITPTTVDASGSQYGADYQNTFSTSLTAGTNPLSTINWAWGDGTTATTNTATSGTNTASHAYASSGTDTITVTATDSEGYYSSATQVITVNAYPIFTLSAIGYPATIYSGVPETFNITTTKASGGFALSKITWNWGDNSSVTTINNPAYGFDSTNHTYASSGTYTISARVSDINGAVQTQTQNVTVEVYYPPTLTNFTVTNYTSVTTGITAGLPSTYGIYLGQGNYTVENMTFNWGDGNSTFLNATTSPAMQVGAENYVNHTYASAGNYTITITATDSNGYSGQNSTTVSVSPYQNPQITAFSPLTAIVNASQNYDISYVEGSLPMTNMTVSFNGDNVTKTITSTGGTKSIAYTFSVAGNLPVNVTLCDELSNCSVSHYTVYSQLLPIIDAFYNESYNGYNYNKINTSFVVNLSEGSNPIANLTIYFGDGSSQFINLNNDTSPISLTLNNTYSTGTFSVYFVVYDNKGNSETSASLVVPISNYVYGYVTSITPSNVYDVVTDSFLFNLTQGSFPMQTVSIDWQDGSANTTANVPANATNITVTHAFPFATNASYNLIATACDVNFCTAYGQAINTTYVLPIVNSVSPTSAYETVPTNFTFSITQGTFALSTIDVLWGDSSTTLTSINSTSPILNHTYNSTGTYTLTAYVSDINGQSSEPFTQTITVLPYVYPYVSGLTPVSVVAGENVTYNYTAIYGTFPIANLTIDWDNGQIITYTNISNGTNSLNFIYTENGNFTAIETVYDTRGISSQNSTIISASPAPYSFTTAIPIINYTITNQSRPLNIVFVLNYTGNATLETYFTPQQDNLINNFICTQSITPSPSITSINPENITLSLLCSLNPDAISLAPQTLYLTTYAYNTAGIYKSITEQINLNTTISLPQIPTPFNQNLTVSTPYPVQPFTPLDMEAVIVVVMIIVGFIFIWFK